jgi:hypothetical protein
MLVAHQAGHAYRIGEHAPRRASLFTSPCDDEPDKPAIDNLRYELAWRRVSKRSGNRAHADRDSRLPVVYISTGRERWLDGQD